MNITMTTTTGSLYSKYFADDENNKHSHDRDWNNLNFMSPKSRPGNPPILRPSDIWQPWDEASAIICSVAVAIVIQRRCAVTILSQSTYVKAARWIGCARLQQGALLTN
jgi:hypothetical protein